ncbi:hypothetical protein GCM10010302_31440 [Streptomyces polychromogenes]|uniref:N-acetyltransferase domain-containing protein n=1 Tax=Streptomyces polychromogenes TaxID=67342 RepID=A0ABP3F3T6_9ACTN
MDDDALVALDAQVGPPGRGVGRRGPVAVLPREGVPDIDRRGWGWWAVEIIDSGEFIGFTGLDPVEEAMPFTGVEAGWRLARSAWGHGYATEAARAGMTRDPADDFDDPTMPPGPLRPQRRLPPPPPQVPEHLTRDGQRSAGPPPFTGSSTGRGLLLGRGRG